MSKTMLGVALAGAVLAGGLDAQLVSVEQEIYGMD